jgi:hypothetical protein
LKKTIDNRFARILKQIPEMKYVVKNNFLSAELQKRFNKLTDVRAKVLESNG